MYRHLMKAPYFPVEYDGFGSHITCHNIKNPNITVLLFHPKGGIKRLRLDEFERLRAGSKQMPFDRHSFALEECLLITMFRSHHPEQTISYRFIECSTGDSCVFLTDHENQSGISVELKRHTHDVKLLIEDCQYSEEDYQKRKTGWGHASDEYVAWLAGEAEVEALGLTHHDPASTDQVIDEIVDATRRHIQKTGRHIPVFGCFDGLVIDVGDVAGSVAIAREQFRQRLITQLEYLTVRNQ